MSDVTDDNYGDSTIMYGRVSRCQCPQGVWQLSEGYGGLLSVGIARLRLASAILVFAYAGFLDKYGHMAASIWRGLIDSCVSHLRLNPLVCAAVDLCEISPAQTSFGGTLSLFCVLSRSIYGSFADN